MARGDFLNDPDSLPGPKVQAGRPLTVAADRGLTATDYNAIRDAALDLHDRTSGWVSVTEKRFAGGADPTGVADSTAAIQAAITHAMLTGKTLWVPDGTFRIDSVITIPNDGATPPKQKPLKIVGAGAHMSGRGTAVNGGTVLDLRGVGPYGKIVTSGLGLVEATGVTFSDDSGDATPFIYTTNTTLKIHENGFIGSKIGENCDQDAIILGGTQEIEGQGGLDHGFQGYGTVIRDNYFNKIRRAVYGRTFANAVIVRDNTVWSSAGSNLADGAAIEFDNVAAGATQYDTGNVIDGNLIEATNYPYPIKLGRATQNTISGNNIFDATATTLAAVRFESTAVQNILIDGYTPGSLAKVSDASTGQVNTHIAIDQGVASRLASQGTYVFRAEGDGVVQESATSSVPYAHFRTPSGDAVYQRRGGTAGLPGILFFSLPFGGAAQQLAYLRNTGAGQAEFQVIGATYSGFATPDGPMVLKPKAGDPIRLGSLTGPLVKWGTGSPNTVVIAPVGSLFLRTDGGAGTSLYVKEVGGDANGWVGK
jgi:hypothetical protein